MFNVIDRDTGWKIDLICRRSRAFSLAEFERRSLQPLFGHAVFVATAEDTILAKLEWSKLAQSERQLEDAAGILRVQEGTIDLAYVSDWAAKLDLIAQWEKALALAH